MKKEFSSAPESMKTMDNWGVHWADLVTALPKPDAVISSVLKPLFATVAKYFSLRAAVGKFSTATPVS